MDQPTTLPMGMNYESLVYIPNGNLNICHLIGLVHFNHPKIWDVFLRTTYKNLLCVLCYQINRNMLSKVMVFLRSEKNGKNILIYQYI
jgi:hypothetical protein